MKLTIAIPTYNRPDELKVLLERLLPMLDSRCKLLIVDNCSDEPVAQKQHSVLAAWSKAELTIVRNRVNVGAGANILRCFELCETEWLWVLGDDDLPTEAAVELIFAYITRNPEILFVNFSSNLFSRKQELTAEGLDGLIENLDNFGSILFTSACVFRRNPVVKELRLAYQYSYSMAAHLVLLFTAVGQKSLTCLATPRLVTTQKADTTPQWPVLRQSLGIMTLLELPMSSESRVKLARKLNAQTTSLWLLALYVMRQCIKTGPDPFLYYTFDQVCSRNYYYAKAFTRLVEVPLYRCLIRYPRVGVGILNRARKVLRPGSLGTNQLTHPDLVSSERL